MRLPYPTPHMNEVPPSRLPSTHLTLRGQGAMMMICLPGDLSATEDTAHSFSPVRGLAAHVHKT